MAIKLVAQFDQCPNCSSTKRFAESVCNELRERGLTSPDFRYYYQATSGVVLDKSKEKSIPIGSELPVIIIYTDICMDCGTIYAVRLQRDTVKKHIVQPMPPSMDGRLLRGN